MLLGGGIGFHGWAGEWEGPRARLSWGCVVLHMRDVARVFDAIPVGAMVVLR
jgi:lipoprotein-anchoring transpeptidase ErfK/SrfK